MSNCIANRILNITPERQSSGAFSYEVMLELEAGGIRTVLLPAKAIVSYRAFQTAVLAKAGILYGSEEFEGREAATRWRYEVASVLHEPDNEAERVAKLEHAHAVLGDHPQETLRKQEAERYQRRFTKGTSHGSAF